MVRLLLGLALTLMTQDAPPSGARITLERTECFGPCPIYRVTIEGDGTVTYEGIRNVRVTGQQTAHIPLSRVTSLLQTAARIGFFNLRNQYRSDHVSDLPTTYVGITVDGRTKRIEDYSGAPESLKELEKQIDDAAETLRWVRIDAKTLQEMIRSGQTPSEAERNNMLQQALENDEVAIVGGLLDLGADANAGFFETHTPPLMLACSAAATRLLLAAGANPFVQNDNGFTAMSQAAYKEPGVTVALLAAGVPPDIPDADSGRRPLMAMACEGNADAVVALLKAGADPATRLNGKSALDCARERRASERNRQGTHPPYIDYEKTVAVLEQALRR
jgi:hypothetical protein